MSKPTESSASPGLFDEAPRRQQRLKTITSKELLCEGDEIEIVHEQVVYRLRKTAQGKLILTK